MNSDCFQRFVFFLTFPDQNTVDALIFSCFPDPWFLVVWVSNCLVLTLAGFRLSPLAASWFPGFAVFMLPACPTSWFPRLGQRYHSGAPPPLMEISEVMGEGS